MGALGGSARVYISGPMTGIPHYNHGMFMWAKKIWEKAGHMVVTPFECNSIVWRKYHNRDFDPMIDTCDYNDEHEFPILGEMFTEDVRAIVSAEVMALLPGWRKSRGVAAELGVAKLFGVELYDAMEMLPLSETALQEAQRLVHGERGQDYGHPIDDYTRTGRIWGALLGIPDIDPRVCCLMMAGVKMSREVNAPKRDNRVDLAGYAECAQMVAERQALP